MLTYNSFYEPLDPFEEFSSLNNKEYIILDDLYVDYYLNEIQMNDNELYIEISLEVLKDDSSWILDLKF